MQMKGQGYRWAAEPGRVWTDSTERRTGDRRQERRPGDHAWCAGSSARAFRSRTQAGGSPCSLVLPPCSAKGRPLATCSTLAAITPPATREAPILP